MAVDLQECNEAPKKKRRSKHVEQKAEPKKKQKEESGNRLGRENALGGGEIGKDSCRWVLRCIIISCRRIWKFPILGSRMTSQKRARREDTSREKPVRGSTHGETCGGSKKAKNKMSKEEVSRQ